MRWMGDRPGAPGGLPGSVLSADSSGGPVGLLRMGAAVSGRYES